MRTFFAIAYSSIDDSEMVVIDRKIDFDDLMTLWKGVPINKQVLSRMQLFVDDGTEVDLLANPCSLFIVSNQLLEVLRTVANSDFEFFKAPIFDSNMNVLKKDFNLVNITRVVDALAEPLLSLQTMIIDSEKIPGDVNLFRIQGHESINFCSGEILNEMRGKGLKGIALVPISTV